MHDLERLAEAVTERLTWGGHRFPAKRREGGPGPAADAADPAHAAAGASVTRPSQRAVYEDVLALLRTSKEARGLAAALLAQAPDQPQTPVILVGIAAG